MPDGRLMTKTMQDYYWYKEHGICVACRKRKAFHGHVECEVCLEKHTLRDIARYEDPEKMANRREVDRKGAAKRRASRIAAGLCVTCGKPADHGTMCARCAARNRQYQERYRRVKYGHDEPGAAFRTRIAAGLCMYCGKPQAPGYKLCEEHLEKHREVVRKQQERRRQRNEHDKRTDRPAETVCAVEQDDESILVGRDDRGRGHD